MVHHAVDEFHDLDRTLMAIASYWWPGVSERWSSMPRA
jgi:hypothetical protein